jgi:tetrahydromethanopterin:alpha-L-glutamate ligase
MTKCPLKIGVVGVSEGWSSERLADAVAAHTGQRALIRLADVALDLEQGRVLYRGEDLSTFDALIVKKLGRKYSPELLDRVEILHFLHQRGVRVFSPPSEIMRLLDRLACTVELRLADIPMPETIITEDLDAAVEAVRRFERAILKPLYTSKARGMQVIDAGPDIRDRIEAFRAAGNPVLYIQRMVPLPGRDLGVAFLGGEYVASYARVARRDAWNTSTSSGGKYEAITPSDEIIALARRAQGVFKLDFTCVDIVEAPDGPLVFEVSAFGGFRGLLEANKIDMAPRYAEYAIGKLRHA